MIVAGEDSGDRHASLLVEQLQSVIPDALFFGAAGKAMREKGVESIVDSDDFGIVGVPEVLRAVPMFLGVMRQLQGAANERQPDAVILVDFPEFNLKLAKRLKKEGHRVIYYISPQLWAWRQYRIRGIERYVDLLLTILPFEEDWYRERGIEHVEFVGNPLVGEVKPSVSRKELRKEIDVKEDSKLVALLPGSRGKEIERNLPVMLETIGLMDDPETFFAIGAARSRRRSEYSLPVEKNLTSDQKARLRILNNRTYDLLNASDAAVVSSGTATLETALIGTPQIIVYKSSKLNYFLLKPLIGVDRFGLANLVAEEKVYREMIQDDFNAKAVADELRRLLDPEINRTLRERASRIKVAMGEKNASTAAAEAILRFLEKSE